MDALDLLAQDNYIIVNKTLIKEIGLENAIVLGALCGYQRGYVVEEFYKEQEKMIDDTGLTEYSIRKAIKELKDLGYIEVNKRGMPGKMYYKINLLNFKFCSSRSVENDSSRSVENDTTNNNNKTNNNKNNNNKTNNNKNNNNKTNNNNKENKKENNFDEIFDYWNSKKLTVHKDSNDLMKQAYQKAIKNFTNEQIKNAIDHYDIMFKDKNCWVDNKYSLTTFLSQKNLIVNFVDDGSWWQSYVYKMNKPIIVKQGLVNAEIVRPKRNDNDII